MVGVLGSCKIGFAPGNLYLAFWADLVFGDLQSFHNSHESMPHSCFETKYIMEEATGRIPSSCRIRNGPGEWSPGLRTLWGVHKPTKE